MLDIHRQIAFWRDNAEEDLVVARELVNTNRIRHGLFFAHLALEKILKAHVCRVTNDLAPPIHNLVRLAEKTGLPLTPYQRDLLAEVTPFNIQCRYPETLLAPLPLAEAKTYLNRIEEVFVWLRRQL